jgi:hypothetical protein
LAILLERIIPSLQTDADVSSQEDSMARIVDKLNVELLNC